jgi:hypothetical protein
VILPFDLLNVTAVFPDDQPVVIHLVCQGAELQFLFLRVGRERENVHVHVFVHTRVYVHVEHGSSDREGSKKDEETTASTRSRHCLNRNNCCFGADCVDFWCLLWQSPFIACSKAAR